MLSLGIDLAGEEDNPTGLGILTEESISARTLHSNDKILKFCESKDPDILTIDAPLSFPEEKGFRQADKELIERGHQVLPPTFGGMKKLTERGIEMSKKLQDSGFEVIEVHPKTSGKIITGAKSRSEWISKLKEREWEIGPNPSKHEVDSILAALTGRLYLRERVEKVGEPGEEIVIPQEDLKVF